MKTAAIILVLLGVTTAKSDSMNFSYMKKKEMGVKDDFSILASVSNWFSGTDGDDFFDEARSLQQVGYQYYDANYGIMSDTQYQTYYNYATGDLYNSATGENYNYNTNLYTYYATTTTSSVTYSKYYQPPVVKKVYNPPVYAKVNTADQKKNQKAKKTNNKVQTGTVYTDFDFDFDFDLEDTYVAPVYLADGEVCEGSWDCTNNCCAKNNIVMPMESVKDLYNLRPQFYNADTKTYSPPGGKVYSYTDKSGGYDTEYGCYGGAYYNVVYMMKESVAYDTAKKQCLGGYMGDLNYINYNSTEWKANATAQNLTAPVDYYWSYVPQKSGEEWNYNLKVCQNNKTMCASTGGGESGGIIGAVFGVCFLACVGFIVYKTCCTSNGNQVEEVMVKEGEEVEVVVQPGVTIESQTVSHSTTTTAHQAYGPPPGVAMMPPPPMPPGGGMMQPGMQQPGMMQPQY